METLHVSNQAADNVIVLLEQSGYDVELNDDNEYLVSISDEQR